MNLAKLEDISRIATQESSVALSKLVHGPVSVGVHVVETKNADEVFRTLEQETLVVVVSHTLLGETEGSVGLILPKETAFVLSDLLLQRERGTTTELTEEVKAALEELGNIIVGNYLRAFSRQLGLRNLVHQAGNLSWGTLESVQEQMLSPVGSLSREGTVVAVLFSFQEAVVKGYVVILLDAERLEKAGGGALA